MFNRSGISTNHSNFRKKIPFFRDSFQFKLYVTIILKHIQHTLYYKNIITVYPFSLVYLDSYILNFYIASLKQTLPQIFLIAKSSDFKQHKTFNSHKI